MTRQGSTASASGARAYAPQSSDPIIRDLEIMEQARNYHRWIVSQFDEHLGNRILEVGAGIGTYTDLLGDRECVVSLDVYGPCVEALRSRFAGRGNVVPRHMDISRPDREFLRRYGADTVLCVNVLEHVADDRAALEAMHDALTPGGVLALLVPALPALYGTIDLLVGHQRRYRKQELRGKLEQAGFTGIRLRYMNSLAVLGWYLNNRILKRREESRSQVALYDRWVVPVLSRVERYIAPPVGLSLVAIARKGS